MLDALRLPDRPRVVLDSPPLALALCQVKFPILLDVTDPARVAPFQRALRADYPISQREPTIEMTAVAVGGTAQFSSTGSSFQWRFSDTAQSWNVVLAQESIAIETRRYARFEDFMERLRQVLDALTEHLQPPVVTRIGLRYINEIRSSELSWSQILRRELLGLLAVEELAPRVQQSLQQILLDFGDNQGAAMRHGLLPEGTSIAPLPNQQPPSGPFYLVDLDVYRSFSLPDLPTMDPEGISLRVQDYHRMIYRLFRWAVTDEYLESLGGRAHVD